MSLDRSGGTADGRAETLTGSGHTMAVDTDLRLSDGEHVVQFYAAEDDLVAAVTAYLRGALSNDESAIVIATPEHVEAFEGALVSAGVDVEAARSDGQLCLVDAAETLAAFMVDGLPDPVAFDRVVGGLVRAAGARGSRLRAYGEMVALLWEGGLVNAAIELERLWNAVGERTRFALFSAYPEQMLSDVELDADFSTVCHLHSQVIAGAPALDDSEVSRRFTRGSHSPRLARQFVAETLASWDLSGLADDATLVVSELAANALTHAGSDFTVGLARTNGRMRLRVGDSSAALPVPRDAHPTDLGGRGLLLIREITTDFGHEAVEGGKVIWADLARKPPR